MPTYVYKCIKCEYQWEENIKYDDRDVPLDYSCKNCNVEQNIIRVPIMPGFAYDNIGPGKKPDSSFNDKLKEIKKTHYGSTLNIIE